MRYNQPETCPTEAIATLLVSFPHSEDVLHVDNGNSSFVTLRRTA